MLKELFTVFHSRRRWFPCVWIVSANAGNSWPLPKCICFWCYLLDDHFVPFRNDIPGDLNISRDFFEWNRGRGFTKANIKNWPLLLPSSRYLRRSLSIHQVYAYKHRFIFQLLHVRQALMSQDEKHICIIRRQRWETACTSIFRMFVNVIINREPLYVEPSSYAGTGFAFLNVAIAIYYFPLQGCEKGHIYLLISQS